MHLSSLAHMQRLVQARLDPASPLSILDIGSYDVNGSYRSLFNAPGWSYTGVDLQEGPGVDIALKSPYEFPLPSNSFDLVISGQAFEHVEFFWQTWLEMLRVLRPGGRIFLIAPSRGPEHRFPQDCWRFYPDGYRALAKWGGCELLDVHTARGPLPDPDGSHGGETPGWFRKRALGWGQRISQRLGRAGLSLSAASR